MSIRTRPHRTRPHRTRPHRTRLAALALGAALGAAFAAACTDDRPAPTDPSVGARPPAPEAPASPARGPAGPAGPAGPDQARLERLARRLALSLGEAKFRSYYKDQLDRSSHREHKVPFARLVEASDRRLLTGLARAGHETDAAVLTDVRQAAALESYLPVPAHRAAWKGDGNVLVATALRDGDPPVAFDTRGRRSLLSPDHPPATPVIALEPAEQSFALAGDPSMMQCQINCGGGGGGGGGGGSPPPPPPPPSTGIYMTYSHFVDDFEGWFKGDPEFEIHILGQSGTSDSLADYQCAGANAGGPYRFDQNDLNWTGSVLLFSQAQLNSYKAAHPNQNFRIIALEDDDTSCQIKFDSKRFGKLQSTVQTEYPNLTGAKDTTSPKLGRIVKRANALQKILRAAYSFITTQDDLIGNAIEDVVVGASYPGANWVVKGENNVTNGWLKLEMR